MSMKRPQLTEEEKDFLARIRIMLKANQDKPMAGMFVLDGETVAQLLSIISKVEPFIYLHPLSIEQPGES